MKNGMHVDEYGHKWWHKNGLRHREDGPAIIWADGDKWWYRNDTLHREDGPAVEDATGTKVWYKNGKCHREDGPAVEYTDGDKHWFLNDTFYSSFDEWLEVLDASNADKLILTLKWA